MKSLILGLGLALAIAAPAFAAEHGHEGHGGARGAVHEGYRGGNRDYRPGHRYDNFYGYHVNCGLGAAVLVGCGY